MPPDTGEKTLLPSRKHVLEQVQATIEQAKTPETESLTPVLIIVVGISGLGKSLITKELQKIFPTMQASADGEISVVLVNAIPIIVLQHTVSPVTLFDEQKDRIDQLSDDSLIGITTEMQLQIRQIQESGSVLPILITLRTISVAEAESLISEINDSLSVDQNTYNELTLGIPKLIYQCEHCRNESEIENNVADYLTQYFLNTQNEAELLERFDAFEQQYLSEGRQIPKQIREKVQQQIEALKSSGIWESLKAQYPSSTDTTLATALETLDPATAAYYSQPLTELTENQKTETIIEALIDTSTVDLNLLAQVLQQNSPHFNQHELGILGQFLHEFRLHKGKTYFEPGSLVGGGNTKTEFYFESQNQEKSPIITSKSCDKPQSLVQQSNSKFNFAIRLHDHFSFLPGKAACALEALLQYLGIQYRVTRPDQTVFSFSPEAHLQRTHPQPELEPEPA